MGPHCINLKTAKFNQLPPFRSCIQLLLDLVNVDHLVTIWKNLLLEKQVIILASQNVVLFKLCEGFKALLYPLDFMGQYIPVVPAMPELAHAPRSYLFGMNTAHVTFEALCV